MSKTGSVGDELFGLVARGLPAVSAPGGGDPRWVWPRPAMGAVVYGSGVCVRLARCGGGSGAPIGVRLGEGEGEVEGESEGEDEGEDEGVGFGGRVQSRGIRERGSRSWSCRCRASGAALVPRRGWARRGGSRSGVGGG
jgi:hypothetical protein